MLAGVVFFFGILTFLIVKRESEIILSHYKEYSSSLAGIAAKQVRFYMLDGRAEPVIQHIKELNDENPAMQIGVLGPDGEPAFKTGMSAPREIFSGMKEASAESGDSLIFYMPLENEKACASCHNPADKTRGMIIAKVSMESAKKETKETAIRIIFFAILLGLTSEIFLVIVLRKLVIGPIDSLTKGAEALMAGNFGYRVKLQSSDETALMADTFNHMAGRIEKSQAELETTVRQRTSELEVIAGLSSEVFRGDISLKEIIGRFMAAVTNSMGYKYSVLCLVDKETGMLQQEYKKNIENGLCAMEIPLAGDHPFAKAIRQARPAIRTCAEINLPASYGNIAIIPILSHQRKRCREINLCMHEDCPAFSGAEERCWIISGTLCRSPQAVAGKEKIYGCLHCNAFPVIGVLIAGRDGGLTEPLLYSLEILTSEIASAIESQRLIESKTEDINSLIKLHDISVERIQSLDITELTKSVVSSAAAFANMDAAILWLRDENGELHLKNAFGIDMGLVPDAIVVEDSFVGRAILEDRPVETVKTGDATCLRALIAEYGFLYAAAVPMKFEGAIYGCLTLFKKKDFFMTDSEKAVLLLFAVQAAAALNTAKIHNELKKQKEFSDAVFNNMGMGIIVLDREGCIVKLNPSGFKILKVEDYAVGMRLLDVLPEASDFLVVHESIGREVEIRRMDEIIPVGFNSSPLLGASGHEGIVVVFRDLTEIKRLQAEVRKRQHFDAMGKVVAGVAHEIRNPLFGISSLVQILGRDIKSPEHQALIQAVFKETQRMKNLIEELLLYSRPSKLNITEVDLGVFMEKIERYIMVKSDKAVFNLKVPALTSVRADADKLMQIFLNLIDNSLNSGCGNIGISVEGDTEGRSVVITVKDDGSGIKKENIEKVFDPFFTTRKEGTGLGLAICRKIMDNHGGNMEVSSTEGKGTTVRLTLPS
ncbi:MAG: ATP-binding protein [Thermodesulfovibrionales bacterium]|nr:ATP-binding protein [Thermodesulfovibrionales bacterium]